MPLGMLDDLVDESVDGRTLIGVDFSLGHPAGTAAALGLPGEAAWSSTWGLLDDLIVDGPTNRNNRFEVAAVLNERMTGLAGPFWGCPPSARSEHLRSTKPVGFGPVDEWRAVESRLRSRGRRPFSSWQLLGAGAVGSQSLLGIPVMSRLATRLGHRAQIWPFTTGLAVPSCDPGGVVIAEVWPSMLEVVADRERVRDAVQVETAAAWLASRDREGSLGALFCPEVEPDVRRRRGARGGLGARRSMTATFRAATHGHCGQRA